MLIFYIFGSGILLINLKKFVCELSVIIVFTIGVDSFEFVDSVQFVVSVWSFVVEDKFQKLLT